MKILNGMTVYEGTDKCALDEYSEKVAEEVPGLLKPIKNDISNIKEEQSNQNEKIQQNSDNITEQNKNIEELKQENEKLKNNLINVTKEQATNINIQDCSDLEGSIDLEGNSVQESRKGYNLLNIPEILEISIFKEIEVNLKANKNYTFKFDNAIAGADNNISTITFRNTTDVVTKNLNTSTIKKFEIQPTQDITNIRIYASTDYSSSVGKTKTFQKLMIYEGTEDKEYEQYGASPSPEYPSEIQNVEGNIDITVCNKNLLKTQNTTNTSLGLKWDISEKEINITGTATSTYSQSVQQICKIPAGSYKFEYETNNTNITYGIWLFNSKNQIIATITGKKSATINEMAVKYGLFIENTTINNSYNITLKVILLNSQTVDLLPIPNEQYTITFPLSEGQKLMKGDYLADDGIHHKRKQFELDGTNLRVRDIFEYTNGLYYCTVTIPFISINNSDGCSTHFKWLKQGIVQINCCYVTAGGSTLVLVLENQNITTVEDANNWLIQQKQAGTPVKFECELAEEEIEPYIPEQQEAYNKLQKVLPYKLVTNIFTDLALLRFNYIADTKTYIDNKTTNIQNQLNIINELLSTTGTSALLLNNMQADLESEVV